ncbi:MAG TPA: flagellar filament capping protein FliD [Acidimicrobiales bacterium]|nr:flagellar filament capping protein FliD [Acidimicrobiales bacterium]
MSSVDGLITGLQTSTIIDNLMKVERQPETQMATQKSAYDAQAAAWADISTGLSSLSTATSDLSTLPKLALYSAASSAPSLASATVTPGSTAAPTSLTLRVDALATAQQVASSGAASATSALGAGTATLGSGLPALGIGFARADASVNTGAHALVVSQATGSATITGGLWGGSVSIGPANNEVTVVVNGVTRIVQIAQGTYSTLQALAGAVNAAVGADVNVSAAGGHLQVSTVAEGSAASLQFTGGSALASLGLSAGAAVNGTDGTVTVDGVSNTITSAGAGVQTTLNGASGTFSVEFAGGLRAGSGTLNVIRSNAGDSLTDLAAAITSADANVRTQTIDTGSGTNPVRLVATSAATGLAKAFTLDLSGYTGVADGTETLTQGHDSQIHIGGLVVNRATNTLSDVVAGTTISLSAADPNTDVTLTVSRDASGLATKAKALVDQLNGVLAKLKVYTRYEADSQTAGTLQGDSRANDLVSTLVSSIQNVTGTGTYKALSQIGISFQRDGTYAFDAAKFQDAVTTDFDSVSKLLARTGSATDSRVTFVGATPATVSRTAPFNVQITQAAQQASLTGAAFGTLAANEDISVTTNAGNVVYHALAGADATSVAAGLNAAFSAARSGVTASVNGGAITLTTTGYGTAATLNVTAGASGLTGSSAGVNVVGTIDGQAATGSGQLLTGADGTGDGAGLLLTISATASDVAAAGGTLDLGSITYSSGAAGGLARLLNQLSGPGGVVTNAHDGATAASKSQQDRIDDFEKNMTIVQARYQQQFADLETLMGRLKDQSSWLASQIQGMTAK